MIDVFYSQESFKSTDVDLVVLALQNTARRGVFGQLSKLFGSELLDAIEAEKFTGEKDQQFHFLTWGKLSARRVLLMGLGDGDFDSRTAGIRLGANAARAANLLKAESLALYTPAKGSELVEVSEGVALGAALACYRFHTYKNEEDAKAPSLQECTILVPSKFSSKDQEALEEALVKSDAVAKGVYAARDLVNEPGNTLNPVEFAARAKKMAKESGLRFSSLDAKQMKAEGMNLFLAVARGSAQAPRMTRLVYKPKGRRKKNAPVLALVGKGITFDSGGLCLKPAAHILDMHCDMGGAAAVFGAMQVIAALEPSIEVHGYLATAENMTGADAFRVNDIIRAANGKTVEIINTDAEGRLVLADTLAYACKNGATELIDLATLTGACLVALGDETAAVMGNTQGTIDSLKACADACGESVWQLPLLDHLGESLKSHVADLKNLGARYGGTISAGMFLQEFVADGATWTHFDIAGPAFTKKDQAHITKGGTGFAVATLVEYVLSK